MELNQIIKTTADHMRVLSEKFSVKQLGIFGSVARGDYTDASDIDMLVEFDVVPDLFTFVQLENHLGELLGRKVDLAMKKNLKPVIRESVMEDIVYV